MPGFGYSDRPTKPYQFEVADLFPKLMMALGYDRFVAAGTDIGSGTATRIALRYPERLLAIHITAVPLKPIAPNTAPKTDQERAYDERAAAWRHGSVTKAAT